MKRPSFQFYPADWLGDSKLQSCSPAAIGAWINMLCLMHDCEPYGYLAIKGTAINTKMIAKLIHFDAKKLTKLMQELIENDVIKCDENGRFFSPRMVDDEEQRQEWRERQDRKRTKECHEDVTHPVTPKSRRSSSSSSSSYKDTSKDVSCEEEDSILPSKELNEVLDYFRIHLDPGLRFGNKTQRDAMQWLIEKVGADKVRAMIDFIVQNRSDRFIPVISTPLQFREKLGALIAYAQKKQAEAKSDSIPSF